MAADFIENPRRFPRVPARLAVGVSARGEGFQAVTEDLGAGGCLLVTPRPLAQGTALRLAIADGREAGPLSVLGRVAWTRAEARLRAGVAFDERQPGTVDPDAWLRRFLASQPGLASRIPRAPERLYLDAPLYLLPPPRFIVDLGGEEVDLLRRIDSGTTPRDLIDSRAESAPTVVRALFALFEKRVLTLALGSSVPAAHWKPALASLALERPAPAPAGAAPAAVRTAPSAPAGGPPRAAAAAPSVAGPGPGATGRPRGAQECFDRAREAVGSGDVHTAIALLRRAIQLSPRDTEIASMLGTLAFRGRQV